LVWSSVSGTRCPSDQSGCSGNQAANPARAPARPLLGQDPSVNTRILFTPLSVVIPFRQPRHRPNRTCQVYREPRVDEGIEERMSHCSGSRLQVGAGAPLCETRFGSGRIAALTNGAGSAGRPRSRSVHATPGGCADEYGFWKARRTSIGITRGQSRRWSS